MILKGTLEIEYPFSVCYSTIKGAVFTCPMTKQKVTLEANCLNSDGQGTPCLFYRHWGWTAAHPYLACGYKQELEGTNGEDQEEVEDEETETHDHRKRGFELDSEA